MPELSTTASDPLDRTDLAASRPEIVTPAGEGAGRMARGGRERRKPDSAAAGTLSKEDPERLRSLCYIQ